MATSLNARKIINITSEVGIYRRLNWFRWWRVLVVMMIIILSKKREVVSRN